MDLNTIIVGVDGSTNSHDAVTWTAGLAALTGAEVVAVHALGLLEQLDDDGPAVPTQSHRDEIAAKVRGKWTAPLAEAGVPTRHLLHDGPPVSVLMQVFGEVDADLVVLGSRGIGAGGSPALLLGSTSSQIAQQAPCPVTIVPPTAHHAEAGSQ